MTKSILFATIASVVFSSVAIAADAVDEVPSAPAAVEAPATFSWAGGYVGALGGYGSLKAKTTDDLGDSAKATFKGGRIGTFAGWNFDVGNNVILGAEGDLNYDWNKKTVGINNFKTDLSGSARARAGYAVDRALLFVAGGWTATKGKFYESDINATSKKTFSGWTIGGGVDYAVTDRIFARGEYRYNDFGSKTLRDAKFDLKQHVINVGVGVKF
ncbi:outer membrane protein [Allorhizobium terrae]|uniref:Porin family protein n=1 Tax=Allorhizobium terrae TaxID=1848972 RepID=A0A4S4A676_9HYPH|nr:outer membrane protein [Allorhizobium terrae]THF53854.1 porin family protein [Allorhizobium terrae]TWD54560.1 outer membrane immunogenic protein [Agrobacterium vitis]